MFGSDEITIFGQRMRNSPPLGLLGFNFTIQFWERYAPKPDTGPFSKGILAKSSFDCLNNNMDHAYAFSFSLTMIKLDLNKTNSIKKILFDGVLNPFL